jgi:two-component system cell cycle sensor histidine kinase/response regulator CckA
MASGIAHDFNNHLTIIKGSTQFLLAALSPDDLRRRDAERISATVERGAQLVRQLMAVGRDQPAAPRSLDLIQLAAEMTPMLRVLLGEQIALEVLTDVALWPVRADPLQIERVIVNLVANAKDAVLEARESGRAGTVTLRTANVAQDAAPTESLPPGDYVMLEVSDTGAGMSAEVRQHIFEPYFTTKPFGSGTGLGLYTSCGIVEQHGGSITCDSQLGQGTTFTIYLPRETGAVARAAATDKAGPFEPAVGAQLTDTNAVTVLVAEDEEHVRELIREALEEAGYRVHLAADTDEAVAVAARLAAPIDLLITDLAMPGSSGCALARRLMQAHPALKVLLISGYYSDNWVDDNGIPGARFLPKPFDLSLLLQHARELLESRGPPGANLA